MLFYYFPRFEMGVARGHYTSWTYIRTSIVALYTTVVSLVRKINVSTPVALVKGRQHQVLLCYWVKGSITVCHYFSFFFAGLYYCQ